jgi:hypothetical protein
VQGICLLGVSEGLVRARLTAIQRPALVRGYDALSAGLVTTGD